MDETSMRLDDRKLCRNLKVLGVLLAPSRGSTVKVRKQDYKLPFEEEGLLPGVCESK